MHPLHETPSPIPQTPYVEKGIYMSQQTFHFHHAKAVNINPPQESAQSKDDIIRARVEPRDMDRVRAFCGGRQISVSEYVRQHLSLDPEYFDFIETLNECRGDLIPLLKRMAKIF